MAPVNVLVNSERVNATVGWVLLAVVALAVVESLLTGAFLWAGFAALIVAVAVLPPLSARMWTVMVPWPLVLVAAVAAVARALELYPETAGYLAVSSLALVAVVELNAFTPVEMTQRFAVAFAVMTTMAIQGLWIVAQYCSDLWLETRFLRSQTELQWDIVVVTGVAIVVGGLFIWYFERFGHAGSHRYSASQSPETPRSREP